MPITRTARLPFLSLLAILTVATFASSASAAQRYAGPGAGDTACAPDDPCSITKAITGASAGDEVIVNPGDYSLSATLTDPAPITIHGVAGRPRPHLQFSGLGQSGLRLLKSSTLRYVAVDQASPVAALSTAGGSVDQVTVKSPGGTTAEIDDTTMRNSIVVNTNSNGRAIWAEAIGSFNSSLLRNVTAIATGNTGVAIEAVAGQAAGNAFVGALNVIALGGPSGASLMTWTDSSGAHASIGVGYSHWTPGKVTTVGTNSGLTSGGNNLGSPPIFVDAATGDYRQAPGSPTIGAGGDDVKNGEFDVDGDPRAIGKTDIGADEFVVAPAATTGPADAVTDQSATLSGSVNANGAPTSYHFEYGTTTAYGGTTADSAAGSGTGAVGAGAALTSLSGGTTYHYRLVATNAGGVAKGDDQTFTTAASPTPPQTTPPGTTPPPTQPFAGVKLVSARLSYARKVVTVKLRCPAATVGRCTGRAKLTTKRRSGAGSARTVVLGRAPFSIKAGSRAKIKVKVTRAGRRLLRRVRRLRGRATNAARDGAGRSKTTAAAVTIRPRR